MYIDRLFYEEFKLLWQTDMDKRFMELDEQEQKDCYNEVQRAMLVHVPKDVILSYFYPETSVAKMMEIRRRYE